MSAVPKLAAPSPWMPFENRRRARDEKRNAVLRVAVQMFLKDGYQRATLSSVAKALNITKPALYNYFRNKEEILKEIFLHGNEQYESVFAAIERSDQSGLMRLQELIRAYVHVGVTDFGMCVARIDDRELSPESRDEARRVKRRYVRAFRAQIIQGMQDGSIAPCDPKLCALIIVGALNGLGDWYESDGRLSAAVIADEFAKKLTVGFASTK